MKKVFLLTPLLVLVLLLILLFYDKQNPLISPQASRNTSVAVMPAPTITTTPTLKPSPTPTPIPLPDPTVYGPCKNVPVLLYHHVQPKEEAISRGQTKISANVAMFKEQMEYLKQKGYTTRNPTELVSGLLSSFPPSPIILTFDDGYDDFYKYAYPILKENNLKATVFVSTGLVNNPGYLTWAQIQEMNSSGLITFANHTWSHKNLGSVGEEEIRYEIETAQTQLADHGITTTTFAYPYGFKTATVERVLTENGITSAFTTVPGRYQCAKLPLQFRRTRIGNLALSSYGL